jgi:hypothetical protein
VPDIITGAGPGAPGGHVRVFDGLTGAQVPGLIGSFFSFPGYTGGINVASGDVNGDGFDDVIVGADAGAPGGHVQVFSGLDGSQLASFFAFSGFTGGVSVAAADFNLDGRAEIIVGAGAGATGGHVKVFDSTGMPFAFSGAAAGLSSFFAYPGFGGSVSVAGGDVNGDGIPDIVTGAGASGPGGHVKAFSGRDGSTIDSFLAYNSSFLGGVQVATADANLDGRFEIRAAPGPGMVGDVRAFDGLTQMQINVTFPSFGGFVGGTFLGGARAF